MYEKRDRSRIEQLLIWSIVMTVISIPFGIVPLIYSIKALSRYGAGDSNYVGTMILAYKWLRGCSIVFVVLFVTIFIWLGSLYYLRA